MVALFSGSLSADIGTSRDLNSFFRAGIGATNTFALTGRVNAASGSPHPSIYLEDGTGIAFIFNAFNHAAKSGDIAIVSGVANVFLPKNEPWFENVKVTVIGTTNPPTPAEVPLSKLHAPSFSYRKVITEGTVADVFQDEFDRTTTILLLKNGTTILPAIIKRAMMQPTEGLRDARVKILGTYEPYVYGVRRFQGPFISIGTANDISILQTAPDPFSVPNLERFTYTRPTDVIELDRRRIAGTVLAAWSESEFLIAADDGRSIAVKLLQDGSSPDPGQHVIVSGYPDTDSIHVNLTRAYCKIDRPSSLPITTAPETSPSLIESEQNGQSIFDINYHGRQIRMTGEVKSVSTAPCGYQTLFVECEGKIISVKLRRAFKTPVPIGSTVSISGVCVIESAPWSPTRILPRIDGFFLAPRTETDICILSTPSWWTPQRLTVVIVSLLAALIGIYIWNRVLTRLVSHKSAELFKSEIAQASAELRIDERTRLAVELHDSLSQNLTGVYCQVAATKRALSVDPGSVARHLETVERMLESGRNELRRCLWDLRGAALEEQDFATAIRMSIEPLMSETDISLRFFIPRKRLSDTTAHMTICIIRELVTNAIRHGKASHIRIAGEIHADEMSFSVRDDGCGFDPANCAGPSEGHFGLTGIRERVNRLNGRVAFESSPGKGSRIVVSIRLPHPDQSDLQSEA